MEKQNISFSEPSDVKLLTGISLHWIGRYFTRTGVTRDHILPEPGTNFGYICVTKDPVTPTTCI